MMDRKIAVEIFLVVVRGEWVILYNYLACEMNSNETEHFILVRTT